jgi:hypothetical protein
MTLIDLKSSLDKLDINRARFTNTPSINQIDSKKVEASTNEPHAESNIN